MTLNTPSEEDWKAHKLLILEGQRRLEAKLDLMVQSQQAFQAGLASMTLTTKRVDTLEVEHRALHSDYIALKSRFGVIVAAISITVSAIMAGIVKFFIPPVS